MTSIEFIKLTKTGNESKRPETTKASQNDPKTMERNQNFKIRKIWNFLLVFVCQILSPDAQMWVFLPKKYRLFNVSKILPVSYFAGTNSKSDICLRIFLAQVFQFGHFRRKGIKLLILTKYCTYHILKVLISNLSFVFRTFEI